MHSKQLFFAIVSLLLKIPFKNVSHISKRVQWSKKTGQSPQSVHCLGINIVRAAQPIVYHSVLLKTHSLPRGKITYPYRQSAIRLKGFFGTGNITGGIGTLRTHITGELNGHNHRDKELAYLAAICRSMCRTMNGKTPRPHKVIDLEPCSTDSPGQALQPTETQIG